MLPTRLGQWAMLEGLVVVDDARTTTGIGEQDETQVSHLWRRSTQAQMREFGSTRPTRRSYTSVPSILYHLQALPPARSRKHPAYMALGGAGLRRACSSRTSSQRPVVPRMLGIPTEPLSGRSRSGLARASSAVAGGVEAIKTVSAENLSPQEIARLLARPRIDFSSILKTVGGPFASGGGPWDAGLLRGPPPSRRRRGGRNAAAARRPLLWRARRRPPGVGDNPSA
jgi:hypothetical protein